MTLNQNFKNHIQDLDHPHVFLGITIKQSAIGVKVSFWDIISKLAMHYDIHNEKTIATPLVKEFDPSDTYRRVLDEAEQLK